MSVEVIEPVQVINNCIRPKKKRNTNMVDVSKYTERHDKRPIYNLVGKVVDWANANWENFPMNDRLRLASYIIPKAIPQDQMPVNNTVVIVKNQELDQLNTHIRERMIQVEEELVKIEDNVSKG